MRPVSLPKWPHPLAGTTLPRFGRLARASAPLLMQIQSRIFVDGSRGPLYGVVGRPVHVTNTASRIFSRRNSARQPLFPTTSTRFPSSATTVFRLVFRNPFPQLRFIGNLQSPKRIYGEYGQPANLTKGAPGDGICRDRPGSRHKPEIAIIPARLAPA